MKYKNTVERKIMWGDLDSLGIVFYPRYYEWIDGCGHLFFASLNVNLNDLSKKRQIGFGLVETGCRYFRPGRYHETIRITTCIEELTDKTIHLNHRITLASDDTLMVEGFEKRICMDLSNPDNIRAMDIPKDVLNKIKRL
ncbi:MAG: acyl-CoA thioesterase [Pseudomonadota bacterium]